MISMVRAIAKLVVVAIAFITCLHATPASAASATFIASNGNDANPCTAAQPCASLNHAIADPGGQTTCLDPTAILLSGLGFGNSQTIDCAGVYMVTGPNFGAFQLGEFSLPNTKFVIRNITINGEAGGYPAIAVTNAVTTGPASLVLENCVFENIGTGPALDIEPTGPLNLVIRNSRISTSSSGILLKPAAGGSIKATFDHVTITDNNGGGIKIDTTNGPVTIDITDSVVSNNAGNGINAVGNAGGQAMVSIKNSVIAKNGAAGVQANGTNAGVLVQTTLFDQNASGATSVVAGGHISTYGSNSIVGSAGSGFTATAGLQ